MAATGSVARHPADGEARPAFQLAVLSLSHGATADFNMVWLLVRFRDEADMVRHENRPGRSKMTQVRR